LLNTHFAGKVVRKDLTKLIKEGANVPVYVLEYLLGMYCASNDEAVIQNGLVNVKRILTENYVRPDEAEKVKSKVRESGTYKVIDKVTVKLNEKRDVYEALLSNLGVKNAEISDVYVRQFEKLLVGGIWCIVTLKYHFEEDQKGSPFSVTELKPIQMPNMDMAALFEARKAFTDEQWSPATSKNGSSGICWHAWCHWWKTTTTSANWALAAPVKATSIRKSARTVFWSQAGRPQWPTCFTTWGLAR
jgi:ATP-dependent Lon protease